VWARAGVWDPGELLVVRLHDAEREDVSVSP
jgi:hypothetical protein